MRVTLDGLNGPIWLPVSTAAVATDHSERAIRALCRQHPEIAHHVAGRHGRTLILVEIKRLIALLREKPPRLPHLPEPADGEAGHAAE